MSPGPGCHPPVVRRRGWTGWPAARSGTSPSAGPRSLPLGSGGVDCAADPDAGMLWQPAVRPALRSCGIGTALVRGASRASSRGPVVASSRATTGPARCTGGSATGPTARSRHGRAGQPPGPRAAPAARLPGLPHGAGTVEQGNHRARALYRRLGYRAYRTERARSSRATTGPALCRRLGYRPTARSRQAGTPSAATAPSPATTRCATSRAGQFRGVGAHPGIG